MRLKTIKRNYNYLSSPLFKVRSLHALANILHTSSENLSFLEKSILNNQKKHYRVFNVGEKKREIQYPFEKEIKALHRRVKVLLNRIELPSYVMSGKKGVSYIDNARVHVNNKYILTMDIRKFYASTRNEFIFQFFYHKMNMSSDLAHIFANICTYASPESSIRKIPTGSMVSQVLAYWTYSDMFDEISNLCTQQNITFSLYVDDMTFSSNKPFQNDFHNRIQEILAGRQLSFKPTKLKKYTPESKKYITGCVITTKKKIVIPNKLKRKTVSAINLALNRDFFDQPAFDRAIGLIQSCQQIEPSIFSTSKHQIIKKRCSLTGA